MLEKNYSEVSLGTVSEQEIQTPRGGKFMCNLHLSHSGVTVPLKDPVLPSKCKQKSLPSKCPCFPTLSAGHSTILFLNTSFTKYFADIAKGLSHSPYRSVGLQRLTPSTLTSFARHWQKILKGILRYWKLSMNLAKKYKIEITSLQLWQTLHCWW